MPEIMTCIHCTEPVLPEERQTQADLHYECNVRVVAGSVGHQMHECSCYGGKREDPPDMTTRQAAKAAYETWLLMKSIATGQGDRWQ